MVVARGKLAAAILVVIFFPISVTGSKIKYVLKFLRTLYKWEISYKKGLDLWQ